MRYLSLFFVCALLSCNVSAADAFTVQLEMKDGELIPGTLTVPANTRIRIEVHNSGNGQYSFFDDFHLDHPAGLVIAE